MITRTETIEHTLLTTLVETANLPEEYARSLLAEFVLDKTLPSVDEEIETLYDYNINITKSELGKRILDNLNERLKIFKEDRTL